MTDTAAAVVERTAEGWTPQDVLSMQHAVGNGAVSRLVAGGGAGAPAPLQRQPAPPNGTGSDYLDARDAKERWQAEGVRGPMKHDRGGFQVAYVPMGAGGALNIALKGGVDFEQGAGRNTWWCCRTSTSTTSTYCLWLDSTAARRSSTTSRRSWNVPLILTRGAEWFAALRARKERRPEVILGQRPRGASRQVRGADGGVAARADLGEGYAGGTRGGRTLKAVIPGGSSVRMLTADEIDIPGALTVSRRRARCSARAAHRAGRLHLYGVDGREPLLLL